jgi:hypothetical protein
MAGNVIFRGPITHQPRTVSKPVTGALIPGSFVEETATALVQLTTAVAKRPMILTNVDMKDQDITQAYTSGDTGLAIELAPNMVVQARMAAATYTYHQPLTIGASGRLTAATATSIVVAWFNDTPATLAAGALADVIIANSYTAA